jgi:hypothetical protein
MDYKQKKFIPHSSGVWEVQDNAMTESVSSESSLSWRCCILLYPSDVKGKLAPIGLFYEREKPTHEASILMS